MPLASSSIVLGSGTKATDSTAPPTANAGPPTPDEASRRLPASPTARRPPELGTESSEVGRADDAVAGQVGARVVIRIRAGTAITTASAWSA
jgi:hypothetical protein